MNPKLKLAGAALAGIVATLAAGGIAMASMDDGLGHFGGADADRDGKITQAEWVQTSAARFATLDVDKNNMLTVGELPPPGRRGHHGDGPDGPGGPGRHGGPNDPRGPGRDAAPPPPPADAPVDNSVQQAPAPEAAN